MKRVSVKDMKLDPVLEKAVGGFPEHRRVEAEAPKVVPHETKS